MDRLFGGVDVTAGKFGKIAANKLNLSVPTKLRVSAAYFAVAKWGLTEPSPSGHCKGTHQDRRRDRPFDAGATFRDFLVPEMVPTPARPPRKPREMSEATAPLRLGTD